MQQQLPKHPAEPSRPSSHAARIALAAFLSAVGLAAPFACQDTPGAPSGPGDNLVNDTMEDAVAHYTQDSGASDVYRPQGVADGGGYDGALDANYAATGYADVQSPMTACSSCNCSSKVGYCLENGSSVTFSGKVIDGYCSLSDTTTPAVGCNPLPAACAKKPTCECILNAVQPPLSCYPECTESGGYFDVFCHIP